MLDIIGGLLELLVFFFGGRSRVWRAFIGLVVLFIFISAVYFFSQSEFLVGSFLVGLALLIVWCRRQFERDEA